MISTRSRLVEMSVNCKPWLSAMPPMPNRLPIRERSKNSCRSFGASMGDIEFARAFSNATPQQLLSLESEAGYAERFSDVDYLVAGVLKAATAGSKVVSVQPGIRGVKNADIL